MFSATAFQNAGSGDRDTRYSFLQPVGQPNKRPVCRAHRPPNPFSAGSDTDHTSGSCDPDPLLHPFPSLKHRAHLPYDT